MYKKFEISAEIARLIQRSCQHKQVAFESELARYIVEQAVVELDTDGELIIDGSSALAEITPLAKSLGVNDVVVNNRHIHVADLTSDNKIHLNNVLLNSAYIETGILVVKLDAALAGSVVGHISAANLPDLTNQDSSIELDFRTNESFNLQSTLDSILATSKPDLKATPKVSADQWLSLLHDGTNLSTEKRRQMLSALLDPTIRENLALFVTRDEDKLTNVLHEAAVWHARVENFSKRLSARFHLASPAKIKEVVLRTGEKFGGQTQLPEFRKAVLAELAREAVSKNLTAGASAQIQALIDRVWSGASALNTVKQIVKNELSVDLAQAIDDQRQGLISFANATVEEFGKAFTTLSLQPAYATHSQKENVGLDAVNEALMFLEAAKLVEEVKELEL